MNPLPILLIILISQNHKGSGFPASQNHKGSSLSPQGGFPPISIPDTAYLIATLRQAIDTLERLNRMSQTLQNVQNLPARLGSIMQELPAPYGEAMHNFYGNANSTGGAWSRSGNGQGSDYDSHQASGRLSTDDYISASSDSNRESGGDIQMPDLNQLMKTLAPMLKMLNASGE